MGAFASTTPAHGLTINATFDSTITSLSNAAQWESAINYADQQYQNLFTDSISINITFAAGGGLGSSSTALQFVGGANNYAAMKAALVADSKSSSDSIALANLPGADPTGGKSFIVSFAQAKALGLRTANNTVSDGTITLGTGNAYTFDPNNRAVPGDYDFIGVVEHEVSEVMGRIGILGATEGTGQPLYGALDLFGYTGPGALNLSPNQTGVNFSIDAGHTLLKLYNNGTNGGDNKDWASGFTPDSYDAFATQGAEEDISPVDKIQMDVIGYDPAPARSLTWNQVAGKWNRVSTNLPWLNGASAAWFSDGDTANFTNTAVGAVVIDSIGVSPAATNVSNSSGTYTFTGGGILTGALVKTNAGTLTLSNSHNAFTSVTVSGGTLDIESNGSGSTLPANIGITNSASLIINDSAATTASQISSTGTTKIGASGNLTVGTLNQASVANIGTLTINTAGTITSGINNSNGSSTQGSTTIASTATVSVGNVIQNSLTVNGKLHVTPGPNPHTPASTSVLNSLTLAGPANGPWTGLVDVGNSAMVVQAASPAAAAVAETTIYAQLRQGAHDSGFNPTWNGAGGITSSLLAGGSQTNSVGEALNTFGYTTFGGKPVNANSILVGYTVAGDVNMDGTVDANDLNVILGNFGSFGPGVTYGTGDINYDNTVDANDINIVLSDFGNFQSALNVYYADHLSSDGIALEGNHFVVVPEPTSLGLLALSGLLLARRRGSIIIRS